MNGWAQLLAVEGVQQLVDTSLWQNMTGDCPILWANDASCKPFFFCLKKYFRFSVVTAPSYQTYLLNGTKDTDRTGEIVLAFTDGSIMYNADFYKFANKANAARSAQIAAGGGHMFSYQGWFFIDINGFKKPNTKGRDIFIFDLSDDGKLYPSGGKDYSLYIMGNLGW